MAAEEKIKSHKRLFIAIEPGHELRRSLGALLERLRAFSRDSRLRVSWIPPENVHLTLKFLGPTPVEFIPKICEELQAVSPAFAPFEIHLTRLGSFAAFRPKAGRKLPLWIGVEDPVRRLEALFNAVEDRMKLLGFEKESRAFAPHLTLARMERGTGLQAFLKNFAEDPALKEGLGALAVRDLVLFESETLPTGSKHSKICQFSLSEGPVHLNSFSS